jgi:hypothetical protein
MIDFRIGRQKYKITTIRIRDYYAIRNALILKHDALTYDLVSGLSGCPVEDLKSLNPMEFLEIWTSLEVMIEKNLFRDLEARTKITHDGVEYGLANFEDLTIGEFADLDLILQDPNFETRLHEVLAVLYRPIVSSNFLGYTIETYDTKSYRTRCQTFLDLPIRHARAVMSFFLASAIASSGLTKVYSQLNKKTQKEMQTLLLEIHTGRGTLPSFTSLMKILWSSTGLPNSELEKHLTSLFGGENKSDVKMSNVVKWLHNITLQHDFVS